MSQRADAAESRKEIIKIVATLVGAAVAFVAFSDWTQYGNLRGCPSTNLARLMEGLAQYRAEHDGQLPPLGQQREALKLYAPDGGTFRCSAGPEYIWPERKGDLSKGSHLIVRCPRATHGFIRTFAWGIELADGELRIVRVKNSGERIPIELKKKSPDEREGE